MIQFAAWLYLVILSEYSAAWVAGSYAIYFLLRVRDARISLRLFLVWAAVQLGALCVYVTLYFTSMRHLLKQFQSLTTEGFPQAHSNFLAFAASAWQSSGCSGPGPGSLALLSSL